MKNNIVNLDTRGFETETKVNIHRRIKEDKTIIFRSKEKAEIGARKLSSYPYQVFEDGKTTEYWAVPK